MKPKDLKPPFAWEERRPLIEDGVFYVPEHYEPYETFSFPSLEVLFGNQSPVAIEYCSGNGDWILAQALRFPQKNWIGVEKRFDRVRKIWSKMKNAQLTNLQVVCGEAWTFTHHYLPANSFAEIAINFPDPWPKGRHAKHRLMKPNFLDELARVLHPEGRLTFVTDDANYRDETLSHFHTHAAFRPLFQAPYYVHQLEGYGSSWFEVLWRGKGKRICYTQWQRSN